MRHHVHLKRAPRPDADHPVVRVEPNTERDVVVLYAFEPKELLVELPGLVDVPHAERAVR